MSLQHRHTWLTAVILLLISSLGGCTVSVDNDCSSNADCAEDERCVRGGGILVRDGVCLATHATSGDAGSRDADAHNADAYGDADTDAYDATDAASCRSDQDCDEPVYDEWSACSSLDGECGEEGQRTRSITISSCGPAGDCIQEVEEESEACTPEDGPLSCESGDPCSQGHCDAGECIVTPWCEESDTSCGCDSCTDCTEANGWYDVGDDYACCQPHEGSCSCQDQEFREYFCDDHECNYAVTEQQIDFANCTDCQSGSICTDGLCHNPYIDIALSFEPVVALGQSIDDILIDESGNDHHATLQGGSEWVDSGGPTEALPGYLHHEPAEQSFTELAHHPDLNMPGSHTVAYWRRRHAALAEDWETDFAKGNDTYQMRASNNVETVLRYTLRAGLEPGETQGDDDTEVQTPLGTVLTGNWYFVVVSYDMEEEVASLFIDDMQSPVASEVRDTNIATNEIPFTIGARNDGTDAEGVGEMDRFSSVDITGLTIFDKALDASQRQALLDGEI